MTMRIVTVGFRGDVTKGTDSLAVPWNYEQALPKTARLALLIDTCVGDLETLTRRRVDARKAVLNGTQVSLFLGPESTSGAATPLGKWLLRGLGFPVTFGGPWGINSMVSELDAFFLDHEAFAYVDRPSQPEGFVVLARTDRNIEYVPRTVSARIRTGRLDTLLVPLRSGVDAEKQALRFLELLSPEQNPPPDLDDLVIGDEATIRSRLKSLDAEAVGLSQQLEDLIRLKRVLYLTGLDLEREVARFLADELDIPAKHVPGNQEDIWLVEEDGAAWCIGEVKSSSSGNIARADISQVDTHRKEANLPQDAPALLIGNTMHGRTLREREEPPHPDIVRRASEDHVLIMRTLDILRIKQARLAGNDAPKDAMLDSLRRSRGGWLEMTVQLQHVIHPRR